MDINRLGKVMRLVLVMNKSYLLGVAVAGMIIPVSSQLFGWMLGVSTASEATNVAELALAVYFMVCGSFIFSNIRSRQALINNLMLPATNGEKFLSRYVVLTFGGMAAFFLGFVAGDLAQFVLMLIVHSDLAELALTEFCIDANTAELIGVPSGIGSFLIILFVHAGFLLTGSLFRKHPFIFSVLFWQAVSMVFFSAVSFASLFALKMIQDSQYHVVMYPTPMRIAVITLLVAAVVFCFWFAFKRYKRLEVIRNKWFNW